MASKTPIRSLLFFTVLNQKHINMTGDNAEDQKEPMSVFRYAGGNQLLLADRHVAPHTNSNPSIMGSKSLKSLGEKQKPPSWGGEDRKPSHPQDKGRNP